MAVNLTDRQKKAVLVGILALLVAYVDFTYVLRQQWSSYKRINGKLRQVDLSLSQYDKNSPYYRNLVLEYDKIKDKRRDAEKNVYSDAAVPLFLDDLSGIAKSYDVKIMQVNPQALPPNKAKGQDKDLSVNFYPLFFEFDLSGSYHQLGEFLNAIERNPLLEAIRMNISSDSQGSLKQKAALTLKIYVQKK